MKATIAIVVSYLSLTGCGGGQPEPEAPAPAPAAPSEASGPTAVAAPAAESAAPAAAPAAAEPAPAPRSITVALEPKSKSKLAGKLTLTEETGGVKLLLEVEGVSPGDHGAHIHETGDCSAPDAKSAGSHYNPDKHDHGLPDAKLRHLGDLGNITVGKDGKGKLEMVIPDANLKQNDPKSFVGRAVIVHEKKDDGGQPVGNAGGRIGCAVISG